MTTTNKANDPSSRLNMTIDQARWMYSNGFTGHVDITGTRSVWTFKAADGTRYSMGYLGDYGTGAGWTIRKSTKWGRTIVVHTADSWRALIIEARRMMRAAAA